MRGPAAAALAGLLLACGHRPALVPPPRPGAESATPTPALSVGKSAVPSGGEGPTSNSTPTSTSTSTPAPTPTRSHVEPELLGATHVVKKGETLYRIARTYAIAPRDLMEVNGLDDPRRLEVGTELFVPGARRPLDVPPLPAGGTPAREAEEEERQLAAPPPAPAAGPTPPTVGGAPPLRWPVRGVLYSRFGTRQGQRHDGIDVAAPEGAPVGAAADGRVVYAGEQSGYGHVVILRHAGGLLTLYAHMSKVHVKEGDQVKAGDTIARVGQSGKTSGPHLHFEVRQGTRAKNPLYYLK